METGETQGILGQTCNKPLKTQLLSWDFVLYLEINEQFHLISMQICFHFAT